MSLNSWGGAPFALLLAGPLLLTGCFQSPLPPILTLGEAHRKFVETCKKEYHLDVVLKPLEHTLWVYLPTEHPIIDYKAAKENAGLPKTTPAFSVNSLDGHFDSKAFHFDYDISRGAPSADRNGVSTFYSDEYQQQQNNLMLALFRTYSDLETVPGDVEFADGAKDSTHKTLVKNYVKTDNPPDFVEIVVADIKKGIETTYIFHFQDLRLTMTGAMPQEEFAKRSISELRGKESIVGDREGKHLEYQEIQWPEFLTKQILNRIRFKYQASDFKPDDDAETQIMSLIAETTRYYHFTDFKSIELHNLRSDTYYHFDRSQLETFAK